MFFIIDPHAHFRNYGNNSETLKQGLDLAYRAGFDAVVEMPDSSYPLSDKNEILSRLNAAKNSDSRVGYGIFSGITDNPEQIKQMVDLYYEVFPQILGLKILKSAENLDVLYSTLRECDYRGFLAATPRKNVIKEERCGCDSYSIEDEIESVREHVSLADKVNFRGALHFCHMTSEDSVKEIDSHRAGVAFKITCGVTPHHLLISAKFAEEHDKCFCMNPPLRSKEVQAGLLKCLFEGKINWIETDHAESFTETQASIDHGFPTYQIFPALIRFLKIKGMNQDLINKLTHDNFNTKFKLTIERTVPRKWDFSISEDILFDIFESLDI